MMALITRPQKYKPGTILEVCDVGGEDRWRETNLLNDPGPSGPASKTSNKGRAIEEILQLLGVEIGPVSGGKGVKNE
jgi:3-hydroxybutyrate dehydrogenase